MFKHLAMKISEVGRYEWLGSPFDRFILEERATGIHWLESWFDISDITLNIHVLITPLLREDSVPLPLCLANFTLFIQRSNLGREPD
jgi:hypothetical protein